MTTTPDVNPFTPDDAEDARDRALVEAARGGDRAALAALVGRHQRFLYNLALRMVYAPQDAEDATQEILVKAITKLEGFEGRSRFRTWLYRIATNHLLNLRRLPREERLTFRSFAEGLDRAEDGELPDPRQVPVDVRLLVEEAKVGCTMAMLMCLDREQRLVYALGEVLGATDAVAAEVLDVSRDTFRQKLYRARRDLHGFMNEKCGLVNPQRPCRCERKTRAYVKAGYVDPERLVWARERVQRVREVAARSAPALPGYDGLCADLHREGPFQEVADLAGRLRQVVESPAFRDTFRV
jgi:RNA polymerase sigma factor (sigma-70 family)